MLINFFDSNCIRSLLTSRIGLITGIRTAVGKCLQGRESVVQFSGKEFDPFGILVVDQSNQVAVLDFEHLHQRVGLEERGGPEVVNHQGDEVVFGQSPPTEVVGHEREEKGTEHVEEDKVSDDALAGLVVDEGGIGVNVGGK